MQLFSLPISRPRLELKLNKDRHVAPKPIHGEVTKFLFWDLLVVTLQIS